MPIGVAIISKIIIICPKAIGAILATVCKSEMLPLKLLYSISQISVINEA